MEWEFEVQVGKEKDDTRRKNINTTENLCFQWLSGFSFMMPQSVSLNSEVAMTAKLYIPWNFTEFKEEWADAH